jgi:V/A-type H+-transporting ATPase subunit I
MIVPMKRVTIVTLSDQKRTALKALRKASLVHLDSYSSSSATIESLSNDKSKLEKELQKLAEIAKSKKLSLKEVVKPAEFEKIHNEVASLISEQESIDETLKKATIERDRLKEWGEFSVEDLKELKQRGYFFNFYFVGVYSNM